MKGQKYGQNIDEFMQEIRNSIVNALELRFLALTFRYVVYRHPEWFQNTAARFIHDDIMAWKKPFVLLTALL